MSDLESFVRESNKIEGIVDEPRLEVAIQAHLWLLDETGLSVTAIENFVKTVQPGARLRNRRGLDVRVGNHYPPLGGPEIEEKLFRFCETVNAGNRSPYLAHHEYETLHPFTDGNGRSGRAIWLWMYDKRGDLERMLSLGFLHWWYYQSLSNGPGRRQAAL